MLLNSSARHVSCALAPQLRWESRYSRLVMRRGPEASLVNLVGQHVPCAGAHHFNAAQHDTPSCHYSKKHNSLPISPPAKKKKDFLRHTAHPAEGAFTRRVPPHINRMAPKFRTQELQLLSQTALEIGLLLDRQTRRILRNSSSLFSLFSPSSLPFSLAPAVFVPFFCFL